MRVVEIFHSIQGEGFLVGRPSVFVRLAGCALRCPWCDTAYAWSETSGTPYTHEQILDEVNQYHARHVVVTGGEPLVDMDMRPRQGLHDLVHGLRERGKHITIETAGLAYVGALECDLMSISPKLQTYRRSDRRTVSERMHSVSQLIEAYNYQLKFVMENQSDIDTVQHILQVLGHVDPERVLLMPQARTRQELTKKLDWVTALCIEHGFSLGQRLHLLLWDGERGH
jgi:7-carboxy-7-deazaguanine synthase